MVIAKTKANKSFRTTTKYVVDKERAEIIGGNMYGENSKELVEQFELSANLNPQIKDPCYHLMLSFPKSDRHLGQDELAEVSTRHLAAVIALSRLQDAGSDKAKVRDSEKRISETELSKMVDDYVENELPAYDFFIAEHEDKSHQHAHIVASRINNLDGKSIRLWKNYDHSEYSVRLIEQQYELQELPSSWEAKTKALTSDQHARLGRDGLPGEAIMRNAIDVVAANQPSMPEFIQQLWDEHRVKAVVSYYANGKVRGIKFGIDVEEEQPLWMQGGSLNKHKTSFKKLQEELGIGYEPERDDREIKALNELLELEPIDKPLSQLTQEETRELYTQYSADLDRFLGADRDKRVARRALNDRRELIDCEEIILASPLNWTTSEVKELMRAAAEIDPNWEQLERELLEIAVPTGVELIKQHYRASGEKQLQLGDYAELRQEGNELVFSHSDRGELFRAEIRCNRLGNLEYSPTLVGEICLEDIEDWKKIESWLKQGEGESANELTRSYDQEQKRNRNSSQIEL